MDNDQTQYFYVAPKEGQTRKCLDPWGKCFIKNNGDVWLCCNSTMVGNIMADRLENILNNQSTRAYRQGLLTGNLQPVCTKCLDKPICSTEELLTHVIEFNHAGKFIY